MGRKSSQLDCFTAKCLFQSLPKSLKRALGIAIFPHTGPHLLCFVLIGGAVNQPCPAPAVIKLGSDNWVPSSARAGNSRWVEPTRSSTAAPSAIWACSNSGRADSPTCLQSNSRHYLLILNSFLTTYFNWRAMTGLEILFLTLKYTVLGLNPLHG